MTTDAITDEALRLDAERTPGEWKFARLHNETGRHLVVDHINCVTLVVRTNLKKLISDENGRFIAHAANNYAAMCRRVRELEDVLRYLASYVGNGGYNAPEVDPEQFRLKICDGIDTISRIALKAAQDG